ncbi:T-complex protein 1 epsilon subunit [Sugiyamaella lignohabitans]|uniref:T-complex protein 1 epsilon subunit n=1 Tax=Sugiyamaella lignohabitans TaxID=796027 RepID=A0A167EQH4_9ASCO|nr:T-complex protein 1 epsilon subunit [Sugiyamaella lignohabitans]ANB14348.1 T-complex protein 1 epsilon subunit [Sugiyamaella lignohabitans]
MTKFSRMSLVPVPRQSIPSLALDSLIWRDLTVASDSIGDIPEFSARAIGIASKAVANARNAYWSIPVRRSAASATATEHAISAAPPP